MYKELFAPKKVIIFDLDGTLIDTLYYWDLALIEVLRNIGVYSDVKDIGTGAYIGERIKRILDQEGNPSRVPLTELVKVANATFIQQVEADEELDVRAGFFEFAKVLRERGKTLVLASNTDKAVVDQMLVHFELSTLFDYVITGDMVKKRKPDPEIYQSVAKHFGVTQKQCLVFEDSWPGIEAARRAKMDTIAIYDPMWEINTQLYPETVLFYDTDFTTLQYNLDTTVAEAIVAAKELTAYNEELYKKNAIVDTPAETRVDDMPISDTQDVQKESTDALI